MPTTKFHVTVKVALAKQQKTLKQVAKDLDISYSYLFQIVRGQRNSEEIVKRLKAHLGIS